MSHSTLTEITFFDVQSRRLQRQSIRVGQLSYPAPEPETVIDPDLDWVIGHWDADKYAVDLDGNVVPITDPPQSWLGPVPRKDLF